MEALAIQLTGALRHAVRAVRGVRAVRAVHVRYCKVFFSTLNGGPCCTLFATIIEKNAVKSYVASGC